MTTTYDPFHPKYLDHGDLVDELDRVYDLCHGCRLCFKFCPSFPTMFAYIDEHDDQDAARLTDAQRFHVVDECFNCKLCYVNCPYIPGQSEWELDFPRLMLRAKAVQQAEGQKSVRARVTDKALSSTDLVGKANTTLAPVVNRSLAPSSPARRLLAKVVGIHEERILPPYAKQRFTTWFKKRLPALGRAKQAEVAVFPTCLVEYQDTGIGQDLVKVYERNGIACQVPTGQCCGAPALHQGDVDRFKKQAAGTVRSLAGAIRAAEADGGQLDVVVPEPTCGYVLKHDIVDYLGGPDAHLVAQHTYDAAEYLMKVHKDDGTELDTDFPGDVPEQVTYHAACHLRAQNIGLRSRDLMKLTGTRVTVVAECSGIDGTWGLRSENFDAARGVAKKMAAAMEKAGTDHVVGDCSLANGGITLEVGTAPTHPIQFLARAYGIAPEAGGRPQASPPTNEDRP